MTIYREQRYRKLAGDLLTGQAVNEQREDLGLSCAEAVMVSEGSKQLSWGRAMQQYRDVRWADRHGGTFDPKPVAADCPDTCRRATRISASHGVSRVE
jgi:hypothetical protein